MEVAFINMIFTARLLVSRYQVLSNRAGPDDFDGRCVFFFIMKPHPDDRRYSIITTRCIMGKKKKPLSSTFNHLP